MVIMFSLIIGIGSNGALNAFVNFAINETTLGVNITGASINVTFTSLQMTVVPNPPIMQSPGVTTPFAAPENTPQSSVGTPSIPRQSGGIASWLLVLPVVLVLVVTMKR